MTSLNEQSTVYKGDLMEEKALVFNIQRYSIHDGEGIRTLIFFKGCPLRCPWCSNPESQKIEREIMRKESLCIQCVSDCALKCPETPEFCPTNALEWVGKFMSVEEIVEEVKKDMIFYDASGGGVTLSGGEILMHGPFVIELLKRLKELGIHTAIETTGHGRYDYLEEMSHYLDQILYDIKIMDEDDFKSIIQGSATLVKNNFRKLVESGANITTRIPLIPTYTTTDQNIHSIIEFLKDLKINQVDLLPFHQFGSSKYKSLGMDYLCEDLPLLKDDEIKDIQTRFEASGIQVNLGG